MAAAARRPRRPLLLRRRGVLVPRRAPAAARQQRHRQVQSAGADPPVSARRFARRTPGRARRRPAQADGVEPAARRRPPQPGAARLHLDRIRAARGGRRCRIPDAGLRPQGGQGQRHRPALVLQHGAAGRGRSRRGGPDAARFDRNGLGPRPAERGAGGARPCVRPRRGLPPSGRRGAVRTGRRALQGPGGPAGESASAATVQAAEREGSVQRAFRGACPGGPSGHRGRGGGLQEPRRRARRAGCDGRSPRRGRRFPAALRAVRGHGGAAPGPTAANAPRALRGPAPRPVGRGSCP